MTRKKCPNLLRPQSKCRLTFYASSETNQMSVEPFLESCLAHQNRRLLNPTLYTVAFRCGHERMSAKSMINDCKYKQCFPPNGHSGRVDLPGLCKRGGHFKCKLNYKFFTVCVRFVDLDAFTYGITNVEFLLQWILELMEYSNNCINVNTFIRLIR